MNSKKTSDFLKKKNIEFSFKRYGIDALGAMALGLFASLIIGLILKQFGELLKISFLVELYDVAQTMMGPAIGVAIAFGLKSPPLVIFSSTITGAAGAQLGGPVGAFIAAVIGAEFGKLVAGETKVDIVIVPAVTIVMGALAAKFVGPGVAYFMEQFGELINKATYLKPIPMGIAVSVLMGLALTAPISSAAIAIMLGISGLAGGAATVGCCAQMIGFAAASYKENGIGGFIAQGLGTSMLQIPNIMKKPIIWLPPTITSAIVGPLATTIFKMENIPAGAGMGTSGLVGQFGSWEAMKDTIGISEFLFKTGLLHFVLPAVLTIVISELMRKAGWIKDGDMKLEL
ncbi:MAG: PTS sugar transporter subunit IIC [Clostridia bacterium]|nr:PTS sugar transporter subunit IIC [Clostridia bacterium]